MFRGLRRDQPPAASTETLAPDPAHEIDDEARLDERLLQNAQRGDLPSFNAVVARHERAVYGLCLRMLRDAAAAEDAAQDTFIRAWTAIDSFRGGLVRPWLMRIATNRCYDVLRAKGRRPADSLDAELFEVEPAWTSQTAGEHPESFTTRVELSALLERALATLPEDQRLAVLLSDVHGHAYDEVAEITGVAIGTVKSRISRGRARLRDVLLEDEAAREHLGRFQRRD